MDHLIGAEHGGAARRESRERPQILRREVEHLEFLTQEHHPIGRDGDVAAAETPKPAVLDDNRELIVREPNDATHVSEYWSTLQWREYRPLNQIADTHRLRKSLRSKRAEVAARWRSFLRQRANCKTRECDDAQRQTEGRGC